MRAWVSLSRVFVLGGMLLVSAGAWATDVIGVQPAALDQPRINALLSIGPVGSGTLLTAGDLGSPPPFNITAFFDTGASGILLSEQTADFLNVQRQQVGGNPAVFSDIGVGGPTSYFNISEQLHIGLAKYHPDADVDNLDTYTTVYNQTFGPVRTQIGPINQVNPDPNLEGLDVFGIPLMQGKVMVMDPRPVNTFLDTMRTYVYNPGTAYNPGSSNTDPGIPTLNDPANSRHMKLTYADFDRFTSTTPGADPPTQNGNPFFGPNPIHSIDPTVPEGTAPPIKLSLGAQSTQGSFLFDTGAAASMISTGKAAELHVRYVPGTQDTDAPELETYDPAHPENPGTSIVDQFSLTIGGIGGTTKVAGFFLDSMLLRTQEGNAANDADPMHLNFVGAPVLVNDITVTDPNTQQSLTLDGIFGMNNLVASAGLIEAQPFPIITDLTFGKFNWAVFDQPNATLGVELATAVNADSISWFGNVLDPDVSRFWDIGGTDNWLDSAGVQFYSDGDSVVFTDSSFEQDVRIVEDVTPGAVQFDNSTDTPYHIYGNYAIVGATGVLKTNTGTVTFDNQNRYTGITNVIQGTVVFAAAQDIGPVRVHEDGAVGFITSSRVTSISLEGGLVYLQPSGASLLRTESVTMLGGGTLDLANNPMLLTATSKVSVDALIANARNGGTWNAPGITSTTARDNPNHNTALGTLTGAEYKLLYGSAATFFGNAVANDDVLVKYTYYGDTDFNGVVGFDDYSRIDAGFNLGLLGWLHGDFDYSGTVGFDDYSLIDLAFNTQSGTLDRAISFLTGQDMSQNRMNEPSLQMIEQHLIQFGPAYAQAFLAAVPEPATSAVGLLFLLGLSGRRMHRN